MKIGGKPVQVVSKRTINVDTADGVVALEIGSLPLNYDAIRDRLFPMPARPKQYVKNAKGAVLRDPDTREILFEEDLEPGELRDTIALCERNHQLFMVWLALRGAVEFDCMKDVDYEAKPESIVPKMDALASELTAAGFGSGHLVQIQQAALAASGITDDMLTAARSSFS